MSIKKIFAGDKLDLLRQELPRSRCSWRDHVSVPSAAFLSSGNMKTIQGELPAPCQFSVDLPASDITLSHYLLQMQLFLGSKRATSLKKDLSEL